MNINEISQGQPAGSSMVGAARSAAVTHRVPSSGQSGITRDSVDTSVFSRLMAKGVGELHGYLDPRPEKIAQYKGQLDEPIALSDEVVSTVMRRMVFA